MSRHRRKPFLSDVVDPWGASPGGNQYDESGSLVLGLGSGAFKGQTFYNRGDVAAQDGGVPPFLGNIGGLDIFGFEPVKEQINGIYNAFVIREAALGDVDLNGVLDAGDIDLFSADVLSGKVDALFDLSGDGIADQNDRRFLVEDILETQVGDADLNRKVEFADFLQLADHFGQEGGWGEGDFDGDGRIDFLDFLALSENFGSTPSGAVAAVPEPIGFGLSLFGLLGLIGCRRRRQTPTDSIRDTWAARS